MKQVKMYCVVYVDTSKTTKSIYVCASDISEACTMGNKYLCGEIHMDDFPYIKQIQECKIKPYVELKEN